MKTFTKEELTELTKLIPISNAKLSYPNNKKDFISMPEVIAFKESIRKTLGLIHPLANKYIAIDFVSGEYSFYANSANLALDLTSDGKVVFGVARRFYFKTAINGLQLSKKNVESICGVMESISRLLSVKNLKASVDEFVTSHVYGYKSNNYYITLSASSAGISIWYQPVAGGLKHRCYIGKDGMYELQLASININTVHAALSAVTLLTDAEKVLKQQAHALVEFLGIEFFSEWRLKVK